MSKVNLEKIYEDFESGDEDTKKKCVEKISVFIYFNYRIFFDANEDMASDFFTFLFPKLRAIIERYDPSLSHIFSYLKQCVKLSFLIYLKNHIYQTSMSDMIQSNYQENCYSMAEEPTEPYSSEGLDMFRATVNNAYKKRPCRNKRQKNIEMILICKCALNFNDSQIEQLCELLGLNKDHIIKSVHYIRNKMDHISKHESKYRGICFYNFYKKRVAETILEKTEKGSYEYSRYFNKRRAAEKFWKANITKINNLKKVPSNRLVAEALNMNRGTISRNLEKFRKSYYNINNAN